MAVLALTGATGFVGGAVLRYALDAGHSVKALIRNPAKKPDIDHPNLTWVKGALGDNDAALIDGSDCLIHIAGLIKAQTRADFDRINVDAARDLATVAEHAGLKNCVLVSSQAATQPQLSDYAASKRAGEDAMSDAFSGRLMIIRPPAVFGPGDEATKPFFDMMEKGVLVAPGGKGWRDKKLSFVFVDDLAREIVNLAVMDEHPVINPREPKVPSTIQSLTWSEFATTAAEAYDHKVKLRAAPLPILYMVAAGTSVTSRLWGLGHLTLGKLREFLYPDWRADYEIVDATNSVEALRITAQSYKD